jgi:hypothetical protein
LHHSASNERIFKKLDITSILLKYVEKINILSLLQKNCRYFTARHVLKGLNFGELYLGKTIPLQALTGPQGYRSLRLPDFKTIGT